MRGAEVLETSLNEVYSAVFDELSRRDRYRTFNVREFYARRNAEGEEDKVNVVVRIDVDSGLHLAPALAKELSSRGISASHYFLTNPQRHYKIWGSGVPALVGSKEGQEVGLHSDHYYEQIVYGRPALEAIRDDVQRLSMEARRPVSGMVYHGHEKINRIGAINRQAYIDAPPERLGLEYHDGDMGPYSAEGTRAAWQPVCDVRISDFCGYPNSFGWIYYPEAPIERLKSIRPGQTVHLSFHTINAFKYWLNWSEDFGERKIKKESRFTHWKKKTFIYLRPKTLRLARRMAKRVIDRLPPKLVTVGKVIGPRRAEEDVHGDWNAHNDGLWGMGLEFWRERLRDMGADCKGKDVLEIGSGPGHWLAAVSGSAQSATGVEPNPDMRSIAVRELRSRGMENVKILNGVAEALPVSSESADVALCLGVFQFLKMKRAMSEIARVLRPGGRAFISANGYGYFLMRLKWGIMNRSEGRVRQGVAGLIRGLWRINGTPVLAGQTPISPARFKKLVENIGLRVEAARPWQPRNIYALKHFRVATNYLFVVQKPIKNDNQSPEKN